MANDHRIAHHQGQRVPFSCENRRYATNLEKGFAHAPRAATKGSVLNGALIDHGDYSLWIEHTVEKITGEEVYWLMWYDVEGLPTIPLSGVFGKGDLESMVGRLTRFVP